MAELIKEASNNHKFLSQFTTCDFVPKPGKIVITDPKNLLSEKLDWNFVSSLKLPERLLSRQDSSKINHPFFLLPNRVEFLQKVKLSLIEAEYLLINGNSCVGKSHLGLILYLHFLFQKDKFRIVYVPYYSEDGYLNDLFHRSFFTFYEEIEKSDELKILLNLLSDTFLNEQKVKFVDVLKIARADVLIKSF